MSFFKNLTSRALDNIIDNRISKSNRETRNMGHKKSPQQAPKKGTPPNSEGSNGDIILRGTNDGIVLYGKYNGAWYGINLKSVVKDKGLGKILGTETSNSNMFSKLNEIIDRINK